MDLFLVYNYTHCVDKVGHFLSTLHADNQHGFKKVLGCNHVINTVRSVYIVEHFNNGGTLNLYVS